MKEIDFKRFKESLSIKQIKDIMTLLGSPIYKENEEKLVLGAVCHGNPNSHKLEYYPEIHAFKCYSRCSKGYDILSLVQKVKGFDGVIEAMKWVCDKLSIPFDTNYRVTKKNANLDNWEQSLGKYLRHKNKEIELKIYDPNILNFFDNGFHEEWINFGISIDVLKQAKIGWYAFSSQITIPCFDSDGNLVGIRARNMNPETIERTGKYIPVRLLDGTSYKFPINEVLYGLNFTKYAIEKYKTVYIVESEKSLLKLLTWFGYKCVGVAMMGSNLGKKRRDMLLKLGVSRVVYIPDNDFQEVGDNKEYNDWERKMFAFAELWKGFADVEIVWDTLRILGYKENACDYDLKTFERLYEKRQFFY